MSTLKRKFELINRLQALGFSFEESQQLRRIEMTLHRWAEAECNGEIDRLEPGNKPYRIYEAGGRRYSYRIADREAGALRRLKAIIDARNARNGPIPGDSITAHQSKVHAYHQTDLRGCALYLAKQSDLGELPIDQAYTRGLAVCA